ncbi:YeeE/YedE family protein [Thiohalobacter sp. IOR34]|uniref:YeeE/YedE family protein n=1 Tax=Thiohalobacter sp. IOR34 TaxID=3057176 RepID=UPI0025AF5F33|nr:YeeE/YedE family protein [Thiohalobacter sp. IOR34]WJW74951.1 YeeE/YedE family protein [Thiohalobacter sp. IOR34]
MDLNIFQQVLLYGFLIAVVMGAVANKTNFCTMGAVSDWVNMGDSGRFRAWVFAMALAIAGVLLMQAGGILDARLAVSGDAAFPPYRTSVFAWPRYLLGGLLFGIGMTLASGCGNKTLVRIGGGNLKSLVVLLVMGFGAYLMMFTSFMGQVFLPWMQPLFVDLGQFGISSQGLGDLIGGALGREDSLGLRYLIGGLLALGLLAWTLRSTDFRGRLDNLLGGGVMGLGVLGAWYVTAGPLGRSWMEEAEFLDEPPLHVAAQSYTFVSPSGDLYNWLLSDLAGHLVSFGMLAALGVAVGSFLYAVLSRSFRIEWFSSLKDFANHVIGGLLMGIGGVLAMGCTVGQGITGASTLALGSFMAFGAIALGSALTMKIQYYKLLYEAEASFGAALVTALVDLHLLPKGLRRLEAM